MEGIKRVMMKMPNHEVRIQWLKALIETNTIPAKEKIEMLKKELAEVRLALKGK